MAYKGNEQAGKLAEKGAESDVQPASEVGMPYQEGCEVITTWGITQG